MMRTAYFNSGTLKIFVMLLLFYSITPAALAVPPGLTVYHPAGEVTAGAFPESLTVNGTLNVSIPGVVTTALYVNSTGATVKGNLTIEGSSPSFLKFGTGSNMQTLQYDPSSQQFQFSGGKMAQDFSSIARNGGFESFSGGGTWGGDQIVAIPDDWVLVNGSAYQYAPSTYSVGSDVFQGYNALKIDPTSNGNFGKITQDVFTNKLQPGKSYSIGVWAKVAGDAVAKLGISGSALSGSFTEQTTTATAWTLLKGHFTIKSTLSPGDVIVIELRVSGTGGAGNFGFFDAAQMNAGNMVGEYQEAPLTGVGDQTIYGGLRLRRTGSDRGGILTVDKAVRTRQIEFSYGSDAGWGGLDTKYMNDPRYAWTSTYSQAPVFMELIGNNEIVIKSSSSTSELRFDVSQMNNPVITTQAGKAIRFAAPVKFGNSIIVNGTDDTITATTGTIGFGGTKLVNIGNVGIGTTSAASDRLEIAGFIKSISGTNNARIGFDGTNAIFTSSTGNIVLDAAALVDVYDTIHAPVYKDRDGANYYLDPASSDTSLLVAGKVGIGTTAPVQKLVVIGDANVTGTLYVGAQSFTNLDALGNTVVGRNLTVSNNVLFVSNLTERVGIGTTAPAYKLDVSGTIRATDILFSDGSSTSGTLTFDAYNNILVNSHMTMGSGKTLYTNALNARGNLQNDNGVLTIPDDVNIGSGDLYVDNTAGNVGIGTTDASAAKLVVAGDVSIGANKLKTTNLLVKEINSNTLGVRNNADTGYKGLYLASVTLNGGDLMFDSSQSIGATNVDDGNLLFKAWDNDINARVEVGRLQGASDPYFKIGELVALSSGNVGIGTTSPVQKLHVIGGVNITGGSTINALSVNDTFVVNGTTGNVGIGTTSPASDTKLYVSGTIYSTTAVVGDTEHGSNSNLKLVIDRNNNEASAYLAVLSNGASGTELLRVQEDGNVGIGTTAPNLVSTGRVLTIMGPSTSVGGILELSLSGYTGTDGVETGAIVYGDSVVRGKLAVNKEGASGANMRFTLANSAGASQERVRITSAGSVGIGTTAPLSWADNTALTIEKSGTGTSYGANIQLKAEDFSRVLFADAADDDVGRIIYNHDTNRMAFWTSDTEQVSIDTTGNVGIGTTGPGARLSVVASAANIPGIVLRNTEDTENRIELGEQGYISLPAADGTDRIIQSKASTDAQYKTILRHGKLEFGGGGASAPDVNIYRVAADKLGTDDTFYVGGNVGIGTTSPSGRLHVGGNVVIMGDKLVDADGSTTTNVGSAAAINEDATLVVVEAADSLCTDSLTAPTKLRIDTDSNCATAGGTALLGDGTGTVAVTSAWAFSDTVVANSAYNDGEDIYIDNAPSLVYTSGNVGIGTTGPGDTLDVVGTVGVGSITLTSSNNVISGVNEIYVDANSGATDPGYSFTNDVDTGMYTSAADTLSFSAGGVEGLRIQSDRDIEIMNGNVGIGTTGPATKLHVYETTANNPSIRIENSQNSAGKNAFIDVLVGGTSAGDATYRANVNGGNWWSWGLRNSDSDKFYITTASDLSSGNVFTIDRTGNVGIGTTGPGAKLYIQDATSPNLILENSIANSASSGYIGLREADTAFGAFVTYDGSANLFHLGTRNSGTDSNRLTIVRGSGNVGIGTTAPAKELDVAGSARFGAIYTEHDTLVDANGAGAGEGQAAAIAENGVLVAVEAGDNLCTDSLTAPTKVRVDATCATTGDGTAIRGDNTAGTTQVTSAWAFNDADTDCNGDGTGGDVGCTASDGIYQTGQDLYIDSFPSLKFNHGNVKIAGDLFVMRNITAVDVTSLNINGSLLPPPGFSNAYDIGSSAQKWRDMYLTGTVDTGQGATEVHLMNQNVRTSDSPTFAGATVSGGANLATSSGSVGIGTTVPGYTLDVSGTFRARGNTVLGEGSNDYVTIGAQDGTNEGAEIAMSGAGAYPTWNFDNYQGVMRLHSGGTTYFQLDTTDLDVSKFTDRDNSAYYLDPAGATSLLVAGNVGIGTTGPAVGLHIGTAALSSMPAAANSVKVSGGIEVDGASWFNGQTAFTNNLVVSGGDSYFFRAANVDGNFFKIGARDTEAQAIVEVGRVAGASDPYFSTGGSQQFKFYNSGKLEFPGSGTITSAGNVGIGTTSPQGLLHVASSATSDNLILSQAATTNIVTNPSFEVDATTGWTDYGSVTRTRDTTTSQFGLASMKVVTAGSGGSEGTIHTLSGYTAGQIYNVSAYVNRAEASANLVLCIGDTNGAWAFNCYTIPQATGWQRVSGSRTIRGDATAARISVETSGAAAVTFYIDGIQVEQKSAATPYADGSLGPGYSWSGTAHASSSSRTAGAGFSYQTINSASGLGAAARSTSPALRIEQDGTGPVASFFDTQTEVMRIADGGNVGIGTTGPNNVLEIKTASGDTILGINPTAYSTWARINFYEADLLRGYLGNDGTSNDMYWVNSYSGGDIILQPSGNVGIGTTSPTNGLEVIKNTALFRHTGSAGHEMTIASGDTTPTAADIVSRLIFSGYDSGTSAQEYGEIKGIINTATAASEKGEIHFEVVDSGTVAPRMVIVGTNVGIGTTVPQTKLEVEATGSDNGYLTMAATGTGNAGIYFDASNGDLAGGDYWSISHQDANLKELRITGPNPSVTGTPTLTILDGTGGSNINVGIGTTGPIGVLHIEGGPSSGTTPPFIIGGGVSTGDINDLYILDSKNVNTGVGFAARVLGINIQTQTDASNQVLQRTVWSGVSGAAAIYLGADDVNQGVFGVLGSPQGSTAGTVLSEYLTVRGNGNVGIGTTAPKVKLHTIGTAALPSSSGAVANGIGLFEGNSEALVVGLDPANQYGGWIQVQNVNTASTYRPLLLQPNGGNVGIGTTAPSDKLEVVGGSIQVDNNRGISSKLTPGAGGNVANLAMLDSSNNLIFGTSAAANSLQLRVNSATARMYIDSSGNVGIGTTSPQQKLTLASASNFATEMAAPGAPTGTPSGTGGSMATGTYYYAITALDGVGETVKGTQSAAVAVTGPTGSVALSWTAIQGAASYKVYRTTTSGTYSTPALIGNPTAASLTDTLLTPSTGAPPSSTTAYVNKLTASGNSWLLGGNVGIGTTTLNEKLTVEGAVSLDEITAPSATAGYGKLYVKSADNKLYFKDSDGTEFDLTVSGAGGAGWTDDGAVVRLITATDNVGIGTTSPLAKLDVAGSGRIKGTATSVLTGSIDPAASTTVTGVGTAFTTQLVVGDRITVTGETRTVTAIASGTSLTVDTAFSDNANDASPDKLAAELIVKDSSDNVDFIVQDSGNVGIGTTGPISKLHVAGGAIRIDNNQQIVTKDVSGNEVNLIKLDNSNPGMLYIGNGDAIRYNSGTGAVYLVVGGGNVGIGTTGPGAKLDVRDGAISTALPSGSALGSITVKRVDSGSDAIGVYGQGVVTSDATKKSYGGYFVGTYGSARDKAIGIYAEGNDYAAILMGGNVGIGTTTPSSKLSIAGTDTANGIILGSDQSGPVNLYRGDVDLLSTDDSFETVAGSVYFTDIANDRKIYWDSSGSQFLINKRTYINGDGTYSTFFMNGNVGIGTTSPDNKLALAGGNLHVWDESSLGSDLITNGGFESDTSSPPNSWQNIGNHVGTAAADGTAPAGSNVVEVVASAGGGQDANEFRQQSLTLTVGKRYKVTFYAKSISGETTLFTLLGQDASTSQTQEITSSWVQYTYYVTVPQSGNKLRFFLVGAGGTFRLDAITAKEITGGNVIARGSFTGGGTSGIKVTADGNVGIGTTDASASRLVVSGTVTGTSFSGAGTGLTGTASGLSIGGNAATATSATSATTATNLAGGSAGVIPYQSGAGATGFSAAGTSGQVLTSGGVGVPTWTSQSSLSAGTAAALAANGGNCAAGQYPLGVDASGAVESCTADDDTPDSDSEVPDVITINNGLLYAPTSGNVGIGTTVPVSKLHIHGNYANTGAGGFTLDATDNSDPERYVLRINPFVVGSGMVGYQFQTKSYTGGTNVPLTFDNAGKVGIGTTSPQQKLTLASASNFATEMAAPGAPTGTPSGTGGSMATGTYYYAITALDGVGETVKGTESAAVAVTGPTGSVALSWTAIQGAASYKVYRTTTSGTYSTPALIGNPTAASLTDTLLTPSAGAPPTVTTAYVNKLTASGNSWLLGGNVGIGTTNPGNYKLNVAGNAYISGNIEMSGGGVIRTDEVYGKRLLIANTENWALVPLGESMYVEDDVKVAGNILGVGGDIAERMFVYGDAEAGDVVIIAGNMTVQRASKAYDRRVVGVVSTDPSYILAEDRDGLPIALSGTVPVKVVGHVSAGDLLTASDVAGYAMRCEDREKCSGAIIGKALESMEGKGTINMLVMMG